jgi:hypothetical protein
VRAGRTAIAHRQFNLCRNTCMAYNILLQMHAWHTPRLPSFSAYNASLAGARETDGAVYGPCTQRGAAPMRRRVADVHYRARRASCRGRADGDECDGAARLRRGDGSVRHPCVRHPCDAGRFLVQRPRHLREPRRLHVRIPPRTCRPRCTSPYASTAFRPSPPRRRPQGHSCPPLRPLQF